MTVIHAKTLGEAWVRYVGAVLREGKEVPDDNEAILEAPPICIEIEDIAVDDPIVAAYGDADLLALYKEKMHSLEIMPEFGSTYGARLFAWQGENQVQKAIEKLRLKWWSKSAAIGLIAPKEDMPRSPCLIDLVPFVRGGALILNATFRSQNALNSYANFSSLHELQSMMAHKIGIRVGLLRITAYSPHIYFSKMGSARKLASTPPQI